MPRATLSEREVEAMRRRLCDAALVLYRREGHEAVTFRRLAKETGVSHTQPYRYFESKEALFAQLRVECFRRFTAVVRAHDRPRAAPAARLRSIHYGVMDYVRRHPAEYRLMFSLRQPSLERFPEILQARREAFDYLVAIVQTAVDDGLIVGDARSIMHIAWGAVHGVLSLHAADQLVHGRDLDELIEPLLHTVFGPLFADQATRRGAHIQAVDSNAALQARDPQ